MTDPVPSKEWTLLAEGREYAEHLKGTNIPGYTVVEDLTNEIERLRNALRGIQSCSTCEACRGAATMALGTSQPPPAVRCVCGEGSYASTDQCPVHAGDGG